MPEALPVMAMVDMAPLKRAGAAQRPANGRCRAGRGPRTMMRRTGNAGIVRGPAPQRRRAAAGLVRSADGVPPRCGESAAPPHGI